MEGKKKYRIGTGISILIVCLAVIVDLTGLVPGLQYITAPLFWVVFGIYGWMKGLGLLNGKKLAASVLSWVVSAVPALQMIPLEVVLGSIAVLFIARVEDKTGISIPKPGAQGVTPPRLPRNPVNATPGVRPPRLSV